MEKCRCGHDDSHHIQTYGSEKPGPCLTCMCKDFVEQGPETELPDVTDADMAKAAQDLLRSVSDLS